MGTGLLGLCIVLMCSNFTVVGEYAPFDLVIPQGIFVREGYETVATRPATK